MFYGTCFDLEDETCFEMADTRELKQRPEKPGSGNHTNTSRHSEPQVWGLAAE